MEEYKFDREAYEKRMQWFQEARFGMFLHWGLYSIPARGEWVRSQERMPEETYMQYFREFDPVDYDPRAWARAAKRAGMKYMVLTAKHHDGFCLFDSQYTDFKSTNTKCGRDLVGEFVEAVRAEGLKVGLYYSLLDWHHEDYPHCTDPIHPMRENPAYSDEGRDFDRYLTYMHNQVRELCTNYGKLDILWFDFSYNELRGEAWKATELVQMVRSLQPDVIIDNRLEVSGEGFGSLAEGHPTPYHGDFVSPEQIIPPQGMQDVNGNDLVWEACFTMNNNWGYHATDHFYKPASMLIRKLVECVSKGGNMLLNVGPDARGNFPPEATERLEEIGKWMDKNGRSIYGCGRATVENTDEGHCGAITENTEQGGCETLSENEEQNGNGVTGKGTDQKIPMDKPDYGRVTAGDHRLYYHVFENTVGAVPLIGVKREEVEAIRYLATGAEIPVVSDWVYSNYPDIVFANLGGDPVLPDPVDTVIEVILNK
ncbi:MAG: alpha-L-fucosidase [Lachnospiraceae bacterium]|nr:alpha-L-fucosidase [Lachnospiraceae bacterium]